MGDRTVMRSGGVKEKKQVKGNRRIKVSKRQRRRERKDKKGENRRRMREELAAWSAHC